MTPFPRSLSPSVPQFFDSLAGLTWPSRRLARAGAAGVHPSRLRGMSAEFTEYRLYRQGDEPRRIDWKLLARTDRAYLRITDDHAIRTTFMLLDASASMAFPHPSLGKWTQASRLAFGLAAVARAGGDPVGLALSTANGIVRLAPRTRRGIIGEMVYAVETVRPGGAMSLLAGLESARPGWRVVLISDFLGDFHAIAARAASLVAEGVEVYAVHIVADEEAHPTWQGGLAIDPERPGLERVLHPAVAPAYAAAFQQWRQAAATRFRLGGIEYHEVRDTEGTASAIRRIVRPV